MPRPTTMSAILAIGFLLLLTTSVAPAGSAGPSVSPAEDSEGIAGIWELNREPSQLSAGGTGEDTARGPGGGAAGPGGGRVLVGRGSGGGVRIGGPGGGGARGGSPEQMQALGNYLRTLHEPSERLTIVVHESSVGITDAEGMTERLQTDNKRVGGRAENGLVRFSRRSRWDGKTLVSEIDIDNGPRIRRRYELAAGGTVLQISTEIRDRAGFGMGRGGGAGQATVLVYSRQNAFDSAPAAHVGSSGSRDE